MTADEVRVRYLRVVPAVHPCYCQVEFGTSQSWVRLELHSESSDAHTEADRVAEVLAAILEDAKR